MLRRAVEGARVRSPTGFARNQMMALCFSAAQLAS